MQGPTERDKEPGEIRDIATSTCTAFSAGGTVLASVLEDAFLGLWWVLAPGGLVFGFWFLKEPSNMFSLLDLLNTKQRCEGRNGVMNGF